MGNEVSLAIHEMLMKQGVSIIDNAKITNIKGDYKIEKINFYKQNEKRKES